MISAILAAWTKTLEVVLRIWDMINSGPKRRLQAKIDALELENRQYQLNGDLEQLRRSRGELEEARRRMAIRDYE